MKFICLFIFFYGSILIMPQDSLEIIDPVYDFPYELIGDRNLVLPNEYFQKNISGYAYIELLIDDKAQIKNYSLRILSIKDTSDNSIKYWNLNISDSSKDKFIINSDINTYPVYVRWFIKELDNKVKTFQIKKVPSKYMCRECELTIKLKIYNKSENRK